MVAEYGVDIRTSRTSSWARCRQRGGEAVVGSIVMLDLAGSDALTSAWEQAAAKNSPGTAARASAPSATVLPATAGLAHGRCGVCMGDAGYVVRDDALGSYEFGVGASGQTEDVIVEALVVVGATQTRNAPLQITTATIDGDAVPVLTSGGSGATFATLLEAATTDNGRGPNSTVNRKLVIWHSAGKAVAGDLVDLAITRTDVEDVDLFLGMRNRVAAFSGKGASSTDGAFASLTWDPGQDVTVSLWYSSCLTPSGTVTLFGAAAANTWNLRVTATGALEFREATTQRAISATGVAQFDGLWHKLSVRVTATTVAVTHDGTSVASGTFSSVTWGSATYFIGAAAASSAQRWPGLLWNVEATDHGTAANGFCYLLDDARRATTYANTLSGTSVGNAAKGTGAAFPFISHISSTDGRGRSWQAGDGGPLVYSARRGTNQDFTGAATGIPLFDTEILDPSGSYNTGTGIWTAPCAGTFELTVTAVLQATSITGTYGPYIEALVDATTVARAQQNHQATNRPQTSTVVYAGSVTAGQELKPQVANLNAADTWRLGTYSAYTLKFTPDPVTG